MSSALSLSPPLASLTTSVTSLIGDHGIYAVFLLMLIDAVLPAASELVMLYAGALAAGAFANQHVVLFGSRIHSHPAAFFAIVAAGTVGYLLGWVIGIYGGRRTSNATVAGSTSRGHESNGRSDGSSASARGPSSSDGSPPSSARSSRSRPVSSKARSGVTHC